jgi:hypothetical protein
MLKELCVSGSQYEHTRIYKYIYIYSMYVATGHAIEHQDWVWNLSFITARKS